MSIGSDHTAMRTERAHAKINLVLRILAREATGYHGIETLFQRLALHDVVHVAVGDMPSALRCDGPAMPAAGLGAPEDNLAWRAAAAYTQAAGWSVGWHIAIEKQIPVGGGLGGGSADAAAVLRALEAMCPTPIGPRRLLEIAGTLGADVAFFALDASRAWAWGRGDRLWPLPSLPPMAVTLVAFDAGVNTGLAYRAFAAARETEGGAVRARAYPPGAFDTWSAVAAEAANDFEQVVPALHDGVGMVLPRLREAAASLRDTGATASALLSGSGATCFVLHTPGTRVHLDVPRGARIVETMTA